MFGWNVIATGSEEEWLEARTRYLTASDVAAVLGCSPYESRAKVVEHKRGKPKVFSAAAREAMARGQAEEPVLFAELLEQMAPDGWRGELCRGVGGQSVLVAHPDVPGLAASPDGVLWRELGENVGEHRLVEVKSHGGSVWGKWDAPSTRRAWKALAEQHRLQHPPCPLHHWLQVQTQLACTRERKAVLLAGLAGASARKVVCLEASAVVEGIIADETERFWKEVRG